MNGTAKDNDDIDEQYGGSGEITSNKKECTSCEQNNIDTITEGIDSVVLDDMSTCANCGKEGDSNAMNTCNKCKSVKYCNAACKKKHRKKHKKACETQAAKLHDEQLFKEVEPEECPICILPLPYENKTSTFKSCCGKVICCGCIYAMQISEGGADLCAFCRTPLPSSDEDDIKRTKKLMDKGNGDAFYTLAGYYARGVLGIPQDWNKAHELWRKAGELGCTKAYYNLGVAYDQGMGVEVDKKQAKHYYELATMGGDITARHNLAGIEGRAGNHHRGMKHLIIAARAGSKESLNAVKMGFERGLVTKDEYASTLRAHHESQREMKSDQRDQAAEVIRLSEES